jgi:glycosyltransferase involved in cell wall biosynthesis
VNVSVVIPVWDSYCETLAECVASVLAQSDAGLEVIVVDNASRVPLPELPPGVRVIRLPERVTVGRARNAGLAEVRRPAVLFFDADDRMLPGVLAPLQRDLASDPQCASAVGKFALWQPDTDRRWLADRMPHPLAIRLAKRRRLFALANLRFNMWSVVGCSLHRTELVRDAGGFGDGMVAEDWSLGAGLAFRGRIRLTSHVVFLRAVRDGSLWYRGHTRDELCEGYASLRRARSRDHRIPWCVRWMIPLYGLAHRREVRRLTRSGAHRPQPPPPRGGSAELPAN